MCQIVVVALLILLFLIILKQIKDERFVRFPFKAIWREMPESEKSQYYYYVNAGSPNYYLQQTKTYQPSPPQNIPIQQPEMKEMKEMKEVKEIYPVSFTQGETIDKQYNVRPPSPMYGALTRRDTEHPFQDINTEFQRVGNVFSVDKKDDTVMSLYRRDIAPERDLYEYKVIDRMNGNNVEVYLSSNVNFLRNKDQIMIPGYESKGPFEVSLDTRYRYSKLTPIH
jgi:hypothetical protein